MLARLMLSIVLVLPNAAHAACSISQSGANTVTVTFGGKDCPRTPEAKAAFSRNLKLAVNAMNDTPQSTRTPGELRTSSQQKLYNMSDLQHQSTFLSTGGRYFGQK